MKNLVWHGRGLLGGPSILKKERNLWASPLKFSGVFRALLRSEPKRQTVFDLFSVLVLVSMLPQLLATKVPTSLLAPDEAELWERCRHTVWEPGRVVDFPGLLDVNEVIQGVRRCLPACPRAFQAAICRRSRFSRLGALNSSLGMS